MGAVENIITDNLPLWSSSVQLKSTRGRGSSSKRNLYGVKKLRELILDLAVRGLLVPQDPNDEPASVLFEKISAEKERLIKNGHIKDQKNKTISDNDYPFLLPNNWIFCRFIELLDFSGGSQPPKDRFSDKQLEGYVQLIQIRDLGPNPQPVYVPKNSVSKLCTDKDIMIGRYGASVGKVFWGKNGAYNVALIKINNDLNAFDGRFLFLILSSPLGQSFFKGISRSAQAGFSKKDIADQVLPLPPFAEQHRIVAKVDELMALCDTLEQQQENSIEAHETLVETLLSALTNAPNAEAFQSAWERVSKHFDTLLTTEHSVDRLKETILQLAVMGKLVRQDPDDEPADVLFNRIFSERENLITSGRIKKQKPLPPITKDEIPSKPVRSWSYARMESICHGITSGSTPAKENFIDSDGVPYLKVYNIREQKIDFKYKPQFVKQECHAKALKRSILYPNDVVMNIVGPPLGKIAIIPSDYPEWNCNQAITFFRPIDEKMSPFIYTFLIAGIFLKSIELIGTAGQDNISVTKSRSIVIPIPPIAEQHRIVAKVDELMALCDDLKQSLNEAQTTQMQLTDAVVENAF